MLDVLTNGFKEAKLKLQGKTQLDEENINEAIMAIRRSLLEADVEYTVTKRFIERVKEKTLGKIVSLKAGHGAAKMRVTPSDHFVQICQQELENLMGPVDVKLHLSQGKPAIVMMVGLQGSGKTTTAGKLAKYLIDRKKRKPLLVAADIYRPAAVEQLKVLGQKLALPVFHEEGLKPPEICANAVKKADELGCDAIVFDTAGRLTIDDELMEELSEIKAATSPSDSILVCDAMMGQDAVTTAVAFDKRLSLTGSIITKLDGDARGGAALSIKEVTGKPIKFLGMGEDLSKLEEFRPEGVASRILGMGDIVGLMEDFERVSGDDDEQNALRMLKGQFSYSDFYKQIQMIQKMGSLKDIVAKLPIQDLLPQGANLDDRELIKTKAIIDSMTAKEKIGYTRLTPSRVVRIANGSGRSVKEVEDLTKKFGQMKKMMGTFGKKLGRFPGGGMLKNMSGAMNPGQGMDNPGGLGSMFGLGGPGAQKRAIDRDKQKRMRKAAKQARKKNRKK